MRFNNTNSRLKNIQHIFSFGMFEIYFKDQVKLSELSYCHVFYRGNTLDEKCRRKIFFLQYCIFNLFQSTTVFTFTCTNAALEFHISSKSMLVTTGTVQNGGQA